MNRFFTTVSLAAALLTNAAYAQHTRIAGTYALAAVYDQTQDGQKHNPWGEGATGSLILTPDGRFSTMIVSARRDRNASKSPRTPVGPVVAYYGTYTVSNDGKNLIYHVERSTFPGWDGVDRKVGIGSVSADRLEFVTTVTGDAALGDFKSHQSWVRTK